MEGAQNQGICLGTCEDSLWWATTGEIDAKVQTRIFTLGHQSIPGGWTAYPGKARRVAGTKEDQCASGRTTSLDGPDSADRHASTHFQQFWIDLHTNKKAAIV